MEQPITGVNSELSSVVQTGQLLQKQHGSGSSLIARGLGALLTEADLIRKDLAEGLAAFENEDYESAIPRLFKPAAAGYVEAQLHLGHTYHIRAISEHGGNRDFDRSICFYLAAAQQGNLEAQLFLAEWYEAVEPNPVTSLKWYLAAAEQKDKGAQYHVGLCYLVGFAVAKDFNTAASWFEKAGSQGHTEALFQLGFHYELRCKPSDYMNAAIWYQAAALQNHDLSMLRLGMLYVAGKGIAKDDMEADNLIRSAAKFGNQYAKRHLESVGDSVNHEMVFELPRDANRQQPSSFVTSRERAGLMKSAADKYPITLSDLEIKSRMMYSV